MKCIVLLLLVCTVVLTDDSLTSRFKNKWNNYLDGLSLLAKDVSTQSNGNSTETVSKNVYNHVK
jgi:hypothetical protein